jgi:hypothetical protein
MAQETRFVSFPDLVLKSHSGQGSLFDLGSSLEISPKPFKFKGF